MQHHKNELLTDPFDDPESYYVSADQWRNMSKPVQAFHMMRNILTTTTVTEIYLSDICLRQKRTRAIRNSRLRCISTWYQSTSYRAYIYPVY